MNTCREILRSLTFLGEGKVVEILLDYMTSKLLARENPLLNLSLSSLPFPSSPPATMPSMKRLFRRNSMPTSSSLPSIDESIPDVPAINASFGNSQEQSLDSHYVSGSTPAQEARRLALGIMAQHTYEEAQTLKLICNIVDEYTGRKMLQGVALRVSKGDYAVYPREQEALMPWIAGLCLLNVGVSIPSQTA